MAHAPGDLAVVVTALVKRYAGVAAVRGLSFEVARGEVFALLGPNGAGKTTTVEILEGHRRLSEGTVRVLGFDPARGGVAFRQRIGIVLQEAGIDADLTVGEALGLFAGFYPHPMPIGAALELAGLAVKERARVRTLSGGQRRRLDLALGLVGDPDLLFLDEPTTGFDPTARRQAWDTLHDLASLDKTILLTSHYMDEVQALADRVAVVVDGRIVAAGTPASLGGRDVGEALICFRMPATHPDAMTGLEDLDLARRGDEIEIRTTAPTAVLRRLCAWAGDTELEALSVNRPTLEDVYLRLIERPEVAA
jgi:ABC-2 type transport system ATP-binding protein